MQSEEKGWKKVPKILLETRNILRSHLGDTMFEKHPKMSHFSNIADAEEVHN